MLTGVAWILRKQHRPMDQISAAGAAGLFRVLPYDGGCLGEIAAIMRRYENIGLQLADASLAYLADRDDIRTVFTLDRRDFSIVRLRRNRTLRLIPEMT